MNAPTFLIVLHWVSGLIVLAVGLAQLEHITPCAKGLSGRARIKLIVEACFWAALCIGAAGAIVTPLMPLERPTLQDACVLVGLAGIILSRRLKAPSCPT
jgi:hypothetical protein